MEWPASQLVITNRLAICVECMFPRENFLFPTVLFKAYGHLDPISNNHIKVNSYRNGNKSFRSLTGMSHEKIYFPSFITGSSSYWFQILFSIGIF